MTLRTKLLLAQVPLLLALCLLGFGSLRTAAELGRHSGNILRDNYRSVLAAQRMKDAAGRLQAAVVGRLLAPPGLAPSPSSSPSTFRPASQDLQLFERELQVQEHNLTEPGEPEATRQVREAWTRFQRALEALGPPGPREGQLAVFASQLLPAHEALLRAADRILDLNQDAMVQKSDVAQRATERTSELLLFATFAAILIGLAASGTLTAQLLRPLSVLAQAAHRVGEGDLEARAVVMGKDEIAHLAQEFNAMTASLRDYRKSTLGELLQAQQAAQAAIDSLPDPVIVLGVDGSITNVNAAGETLLALEPGRSQGGLAALPEGLRKALEAARAHVVAGRGPLVPKGLDEAIRLDGPGGPRQLLPRASPVYSEDGAVVGASIVLQDVTRLLRFDELRDDLVATVAHELRTPLTSLRMALHLLLEEAAGPLAPQQADLLHTSREDCDRLQGIVDDLLDLTRIRSGQVEVDAVPISSKALVEAAVDEQTGHAKTLGVALEASLQEPILPVLADPARASLVLTNLVSNALRHSPAGGVVTLLAAPSQGDRVRFEVSDQGPGIAREHQERVFEKFFRVPGTQGDGIGLGLYIAREIVRAHGGEMGLQSEPGQGCRFWFTLPCPKASAG